MTPNIYFKENKNNKNVKNYEPSYAYYSKVLNKPFDTVNALKEAEEAYFAEIKAKEDKAATKKADAKKVEDAFKCLNAARKVYKERMAELTAAYTEDLKKLKANFESDKASTQNILAKREEEYSAALKAFTDKYPEGYHLTLKDGDFETTISSQSALENKPYALTTIADLFDSIFNF